MRKIVLIALVALCASFQGEVRAENAFEASFQTLTLESQVGEIELEWVLNQVVEQTGMTYSEVRSLYESKKLTIEKVVEGYEVTYTSAAEGGSLTTILIGSDL